jgi:hypothetical protein
MALARFKSNLRFAFHKETAENRSDFPINRSEQIGNILSWFAYEFRFVFIRTLCDPRFITVCFTSIAMLITALLFYPSDTWNILFKSCIWVIEHINWNYVRFTLWVVCEATILGMGLRAFGRFSNRNLMEHHGVV